MDFHALSNKKIMTKYGQKLVKMGMDMAMNSQVINNFDLLANFKHVTITFLYPPSIGNHALFD
jgi:hypothetical protein